jgi:hypothetical protein
LLTRGRGNTCNVASYTSRISAEQVAAFHARLLAELPPHHPIFSIKAVVIVGQKLLDS